MAFKIGVSDASVAQGRASAMHSTVEVPSPWYGKCGISPPRRPADEDNTSVESNETESEDLSDKQPHESVNETRLTGEPGHLVSVA